MNTRSSFRRALLRSVLLLALITPAMPLSVGLHAQTPVWEPMNRGLLHLLLYTLEIDTTAPLVMYTGTDYGNIYKSYDGSFNWMLHREGISSEYDGEIVTALWLEQSDRTTLYAGYGGRKTENNLFRSTNAGNFWTLVPTPVSWKNGGILHVFRSDITPPRIFCGLGWYNGIWYCTEGEWIWHQILEKDGVQVIAGHHARPAILLAGTAGNHHTGCLLYSSDGGAAWEKRINGLVTPNENTGVRTIAFSPSDPNTVYAGVTGAGNGLYRSTNCGAEWTRIMMVDQISGIAVHPRNENLIYVSTVHAGMMRSTDGGLNWQTINDGLPSAPMMRVRIAPGYPVQVFAVTLNYGIYRLVDEELPESMFP
jgi:hypothetical protein